MCIVTGPNIDLAIKLIKRMKDIFETKLGLIFRNKETVIELNGCQIEAYPSNHLDSFRSLTNPKFIFLDEADMFRKGEQEDVRHVSGAVHRQIRPLHRDGINAGWSWVLFYKIEASQKTPAFTEVLNLITLMVSTKSIPKKR